MGVCILHINSLCFFSVIWYADIYSLTDLHVYGDCVFVRFLFSDTAQEFIPVQTIRARQEVV